VKLFKRSKQSFLAILVFAIVCLPIQSWSADLHVILITDTLAPGIEQSVKADLTTLQNKVKIIANYTGLNLKETVFVGESLTTGTVMSALNEMIFESEDVVIFYYSGHGYRAYSKKNDNPWPTLFFSKENRGIDFYSLTELIMQKKPRFLLSLADCCNNIIMDGFIPEVKVSDFSMRTLNTFSMEERLRQNYTALFLKSKGTILISSSKTGEFSWGTKYGGLYTQAFFEFLDAEVKGFQEPSWNAILQRAAYEVDELEHPEHLLLPQKLIG
jgi:hypothetical protein